MYPIIKPDMGIKELFALFKPDSVEDFEKAFARKIGSKYALAFPYGRSALYAIFKGLKLKNKRVLTPAYTCVVVQNAVVLTDNTPLFSDINLNDFNMTEKKACDVYIPTHMYGNPLKFSKPKNTLVIEDACLGLMNKIDRKNLGTIGDIGFFSFNISKQMTTFDGSMLITDNKEYYDKIKKYRDKDFSNPGLKNLRILVSFLASYVIYLKPIYGLLQKLRDIVPFLGNSTAMESWNLDHIDLPDDYNTKMTSIQAKIGLAQLGKLDKILETRKKIVGFYDKHLKISGKPKIKKSVNYSHYTVLVKNRENAIKKLRNLGVNVGIAMNYSVPDTPAYRPYKDKNYPKTVQASEEAINLPLYAALTESDVKKICEKVSKVVNDENNS